MEVEKIIVKKKRAGFTEAFDPKKIHAAIRKSADRVLFDMTDKDCKKVSDAVVSRIEEPEVTVRKLHKLVEVSLDECGFNKVAESYRQYRNYKIDAQKIMEAVDAKTLELSYKADKSNANCDSSLVSTKRSLIYGEQQKERYRRVFLNEMEREALSDGYIYAHDQSARLDSYNCLKISTKFITSVGIKSFYDFKDGDEITVLTPYGNWKKAVVKSYGEKELREIIFTNNKGEEKAVWSTDNHRWILSDNTITTDLKVGDLLLEIPKLAHTSCPEFFKFEEDGDKVAWEVKSITPDGTKETVWCLEVEDDHSFVLEGGIPTGNCSLFNLGKILKNGFMLSSTEYNEPQSLQAAISVTADVLSVIAGNQYGGLTAPEIDTVLVPYAQKSYEFYLNQYKELIEDSGGVVDPEKQDKYAIGRVIREAETGFQQIEMSSGSVASCRGDYPFLSFSFGHDKSKWGSLIASTILKVRKGGQGKPGSKVPVVFPKLIFLFDSDLHGKGKDLEWLFDEAIECTKIAQYPDYLSLDQTAEGETPNYVGNVYHKWGKIVSPMGKQESTAHLKSFEPFLAGVRVKSC